MVGRSALGWWPGAFVLLHVSLLLYFLWFPNNMATRSKKECPSSDGRNHRSLRVQPQKLQVLTCAEFLFKCVIGIAIPTILFDWGQGVSLDTILSLLKPGIPEQIWKVGQCRQPKFKDKENRFHLWEREERSHYKKGGRIDTVAYLWKYYLL